MPQQYYHVEDAFAKPNRWYLREPRDEMGNEIDARIFAAGNRFTVSGPLHIPLRMSGVPVDFTFGPFEMLVVHRRVGILLEELCGDGIQRIPVRIKESHDYEILNILEVVKCIDEQRSRIMWWTEKDHRRDLAGTYRSISRLEIDADRTEGKHLFRPYGWLVTALASDLVKTSFQRAHVTGAKFLPLPWDAVELAQKERRGEQ